MKIEKRRYILLIALFFCTRILFAQSVLQIQEYSTDNGLPQRNVSNIIQDHYGFIWFATWNGVCQFDGYTFKNYKVFPDDETNLINNRFHLNGIDKNNDVWCRAYESRFYRLDVTTGKFIDPLLEIEKKHNKKYRVEKTYNLMHGATWMVCPYTAFRVENISGKDSLTEYSQILGNLPGNRILNIQQDSEGDEWIFTNKGTLVIGEKQVPNQIPYKELCELPAAIFLISDSCLVGYDKQSKEYYSIDLPYEFDNLLGINALDDKSIAVGTEKGLYIYSTQTRKIRYERLDSLGKGLKKVRYAYKDKYGDLWVFTNLEGVIHIKKNDQSKRLLLSEKVASPSGVKKSRMLIFEDKQGVLWLTPDNGSFSYYDRERDELLPYRLNPNDPKSIYNPLILSSLYDGQNTLWFSDNKCLNKVSFFPNASKLHLLDNRYETRALFNECSGQLWVANKKMYVRIYHPDGKLKGYLTANGEISRQSSCFQRAVYCFMQGQDGKIWLGTKGSGVLRLTKLTEDKYRVEQFVHNEKNPYSLSHNEIYSICQDHNGRIWIGTHGGGLNLFEEDSKGNIRFLHGRNDLNYSIENYSKVRYVTELRNTLFVGTSTGLLTFDLNYASLDSIIFYENKFRPNDVTSLCSDNVMHIYEDSKKDIYVMTFSGGINRLSSDVLLTNNMQFKRYTEQHGLPSDMVFSMIEDQMRNLWVVSANSFFKFNSLNDTFDSYDDKYLRVEQIFNEAIPVIWNNKLILGLESGFLEIAPDKLIKSKYQPPVYLTELSIAGESLKKPLIGVKSLELEPNQRNISLSFTALDYIDPLSIKYAYRLKGLEEHWTEIDYSRQARYVNLHPGTYEFQVNSTNSDGQWFENYARLKIHVIPTFWETGWAILLYAIIAVIGVVLIVYIFMVIYRLRYRVNMEQQLANIKLRFFTDISHELRTPLTLITSPVEEVLEHGNLSPKERNLLDLVHKNTERMLQLVNQILDFRKIENQKMKLLLEETEVVEMVRDVMANFSLMAKEKSINFCMNAEVSTVYAWIDRDKFQKILQNLISNAFKYTPTAASITVRIVCKEDTFAVSVQDEGKGIDSEKIPLLFKRFETLVQDNILQPSSGIGLSLVKEMVDLHLGTIEVESEVGKGTNFVVTLPTAKQMYQDIDYVEYILNDGLIEQPLRSKQEGMSSDENVIKILVVEDNAELRTFLKDILNDTYQVIEASDGKEGFELAVQQLPDFIISDVMMPRMDGLDMVKAIKENREVSHIPIVLLSAKSSLDDRIHGLERGVDDYITKPFSSTYLKTRIRLLLQQRKQLQEYYVQNVLPFGETSLNESDDNKLSPLDIRFMKQVVEVVEKNLDNSNFSVDEFAQELQMGRTSFYRKLKSITGLSPIDYILDIRIKRSVQLLKEGKHNISSIAYMTGFDDPKYFTKFFKKRIGITPSEYVKQLVK